MKQSPLAIAKAKFNISEENPTLARKAAKEKLVSAVEALTNDGLWIDRVDSEKGLRCVSNKKLLKLHTTLTAVKDAGGREGVIKSILESEKRTKDAHYAARFEKWPTPRLWDYYQNSKRNKQN